MPSARRDADDCDPRQAQICNERMDALEQRLEDLQDATEKNNEGMWTVLRKVSEDVTYMRGRFDQMVTMPAAPAPAAAEPPRRRQMVVQLGLGAGGAAALLELLHHLFR